MLYYVMLCYVTWPIEYQRQGRAYRCDEQTDGLNCCSSIALCIAVLCWRAKKLIWALCPFVRRAKW